MAESFTMTAEELARVIASATRRKVARAQLDIITTLLQHEQQAAAELVAESVGLSTIPARIAADARLVRHIATVEPMLRDDPLVVVEDTGELPPDTPRSDEDDTARILAARGY